MSGKILKMVLRNSLRNKGYTLINITGLAIGMACSILILLWVFDELSYDKFHKNVSNTYKVYEKNFESSGIAYSSSLPAPIGPGITKATPGITDFARIYSSNYTLKYENRSYDLRGLIVDTSFLDIFSFPLISGSSRAVLADVNSIVLTEKAAGRIFGNEDPIGKMVLVDKTSNLMITGVAAAIPKNSSLQFDFLVPISLMEAAGYDMNNWGDSRFLTFVKIADESSSADISEKIRYFEQTYWPSSKSELDIQPFSETHLYDLEGGGLIVYVYVFLSIALIIISIACINFVNLMTASAFARHKEIGVRKSVGASRLQLIFQFMGETLAIVFISVIIAWSLIEIVLPEYNSLTGKEFSSGIIGNPNALLASIGLIILTVLLAGGYPALYLSSMKPISLINKYSYSERVSGIGLIRKSLVIFQFVLSVILMISALIIFNQMNYIKAKQLGLEKENIVCIRMEDLSGDYRTFKQELLSYPEIVSATATLNPPAWVAIGTAAPMWQGMDKNQRYSTALFFTDVDFIKTFGIEMAAGRAFSEETATDMGKAFIVNEAAVRAMNLDSPIGAKLSWNNIEGEIVGVTRDFHFQSLYHEIQPMAMLAMEWYNYLCIKIDPNSHQVAIDIITNVFNKLRPTEEFSYTFFADLVNDRYIKEERLYVIIKYFAIMAILITSIGLLGLTSLIIKEKTKEIGIRKVLGASVPQIVLYLSGGYIRWIIISNIIAWPTAYYMMHKWLQNFAYHIEIYWIFFVLSGLIAAVIALLTVSFQTIKAARANPVETLRYE